MKILMINTVCGVGSTGRICADIADFMQTEGHDCIVAYGRGRAPERCEKYAVRIGNALTVCLHGLMARVFDRAGFGSRGATRRLIKKIRQYDPDVIHLHNLHGYYLDVQTLFAYLKQTQKPVVWTLHDCWAFTGHCAHYSAFGCQKWREQCHHCGQKRAYPASFLFDRSRDNYRRKRALFTAPENMVLVAPSKWLAGQVRASFLGGYPLEVIYNGVDRSVFRPFPSDVKCRYGLQGQKLALGVASRWDEQKGLPFMLRLAEMLGADWTVVLVGLTARQIAALPAFVVGIPQTQDRHELAAWYGAADVYVNVSAQESMGMTSAEAICCAAPVAAFDATATPEIVGENGLVVRYGDVDALADAVRQLGARGKAFVHGDGERFALERQCEAYRRLYQQWEA